MFKFGRAPIGAFSLLAALLAGCHGAPGASVLPQQDHVAPQWIVLPTSKPTAVAASLTLSVTPQSVNNPTAVGAKSLPKSVVATVVVRNAAGAIIPANTLAKPVVVTFYGPSGAVSPSSATVTSSSGTVSFTYSGSFLEAPLYATAVSGTASATAQVLLAHPACAIPASDTASTATLSTPSVNLASGWHMKVSVGGGPAHNVLIDTGSRGLLIPSSVIGAGAVGPGAAGSLEYTSDGKIFSGHYYLAPVTLDVGNANIVTVPIKVLGVDSESCDPKYPTCKITTPVGSLGNMGVGFSRPENIGGPAVNPFLQTSAMAQGQSHPGYEISASGVTLGVTSSALAAYASISLAPLSPVNGTTSFAGDWAAPPACFAFPALSPSWHCGTILVDTGMSGMILGLTASQRPPSIASANPLPAGLDIAIAAPTAAASVLGYSFVLGDASNPLAPTASVNDPAARWTSSAPFVNTGRNVIAGYDYIFDAGCGRVGFHKAP